MQVSLYLGPVDWLDKGKHIIWNVKTQAGKIDFKSTAVGQCFIFLRHLRHIHPPRIL
jgi:hypothetical protein